MTRLLITALLLACLVGGAMGAVSPVKVNFQGSTSTLSGASTTTPDTYGRIYDVVYSLNNAPPSPYTYASWTLISHTLPGNGCMVNLLGSSGNLLYNQWIIPVSVGSRYQIKMIGDRAVVYVGETPTWSSGILAENPSYLVLYTNGGVTYTIDDIVVGYSDDATIIGPPPSDWFILYDSIAPASIGLYQSSSVVGGSPTLKNSNYFGASYGRGSSTATNLQLINPIGAVVHSYPVANMSSQCSLPITDLMQDGLIMPGYWTVQMEDAPLAQEHFWVLSGTASIAMDKTSYLVGDTGIATYSIPSSYWDTTTYSYKLRTVDIYGTTLSETTISSASSSQYVTFATADGAGVRFVEVIRIRDSDSTESIIGYTSTQVYEYLGFNIHTYDGNTTAALSGVSYTFTQGSTTVSGTTGYDGNATASGFGTGVLLNYSFYKTGYYYRNYSMTPTTTGTKILNVTMEPSPPIFTGVGMGGTITDSVYGNTIPSVTVLATNGTESHSVLASSAAYYIFDDSRGGPLVSGKCYHITATKTGYTFKSPTECKVV